MWPREGVLSLALEEYFDLVDAMDELERRREKLRNVVLAELRGALVTRMPHPRGSLRIDRYASYEVPSPSRVVPLLVDLAWVDEVVRIDGRTLYKMAKHDADVQMALRGAVRVREHEVLVITPKRKGGAPR